MSVPGKPRGRADTLIMRMPVVGLLALLCAGACIGCGGGGNSTPGAASPPIATATATATATASASPSHASKAALHGLVSMGNENFNDTTSDTPDNAMEEINAHPGVYVGAVILATWAQLEPAQGSFDTSVIDSALQTIAAYNAAHPTTPVVGKLRVFAGTHVPAWLFAVAGGPITLTKSSGYSGQFAAFWSTGYRTAWRALQAHLAGTYDKSAAIGEVAISSCASLTAEPFVTPLDPTSLSALHMFGYSDSAMESCLQAAPADYAAWSATPLDYTFNSFRTSDSGSLVEDPTFTTSEMQAFRTALGSRAVVANHGLQDPLTAGAQAIYPEFTALGPPIEFQTYSPTVDWPTTFALGLTYEPSEVEIWQTIAAGGQADLSQSELATFASEL